MSHTAGFDISVAFIGSYLALLCFVCGPPPPPERGLLARFLRRGTRPPRQQRPAPLSRSRGAAHARARPRRRKLRRVSPQSTGLSGPLSVLTQPLGTGMIFCRVFFGSVLCDLRPPGSVDQPAGAAVVRTCAGGRKVERSTTCFTRPVHTCHPQVSLRLRLTHTYVRSFQHL